MKFLSLAFLACLAIVFARGAHAGGTYSCETIDAHIASHKAWGEERLADAKLWTKGKNSTMASMQELFNIWNPVPTSVEDYIEGEVEDKIKKICKGGIRHVLGGIDMTSKLLKSANVLINENSGFSAGAARAAMLDVRRATRAMEAHLKWKRENCKCEQGPADTPPAEEEPESGESPKPVPTKPSGGLTPGRYNGGSFGTVTINADGSGTYDGTWDKSQLGQIQLRLNSATGLYSGTWMEDQINRHGVLRDVSISPDGRIISGNWETTAEGDRAPGGGTFTFELQ